MSAGSSVLFFLVLPLFLLSLHLSPSSVSGGRPQPSVDVHTGNSTTTNLTTVGGGGEGEPLPELRTCALYYPPWLRRRVRIFNNVSWNRWVTIGCNSKRRHIGVHYLRPNEELSWTFYSDTVTLYWCNAYWGDSKSPHYNLSFYAYDSRVDDFKCSHCFWYIKDDGAWFYDGCGHPTVKINSSTIITP